MMGRKPRFLPENVLGFDTETDNDGATAWICQWCIHDGRIAYIGKDCTDLEPTILSLANERGSIILYVFNLKYDLEFIKPVIHDLEEMGWDSAIIMRKGAPIKVALQKEQTIIEFRDAMKKMPGNLKSLGKMIGLPKLESPYGFEPGWSKRIDYSTGSHDFDYCKRDSEIVAVAMQRLHEGNADGYRFDRTTLSGDAWRIAKQMLAGKDVGAHNDKWERYFPRLSLDLDRRIRRAYFGGINLSPMHNHGVNRGHITHEDVHNSYGGVMGGYQGYPLPYGMPVIQHELPPDGTLYVADVRIRMSIKPEYEGNEWYQFKNGTDNVIEGLEHGTPVHHTNEWHDLTLTNVDLDLLEDWYDVEYNEYFKPTFYVFSAKIGLMLPYLEYFTRIKESAVKNGLEYTHAKRMLNSFYGRTGLAPETSETTLVWDDALGFWNWHTEYTLKEDNDAYIPYAVFCSAWARKTLLDNVRACLDAMPDSVIHCDTDSVIHYGPPVEGITHGDHVGTWGIESEPPVVIEAGFKRYVELERYPMESWGDFISCALAGVPQHTVEGIDHEGKPCAIPVGMWVEVLDEPTIILEDGYQLGHEDYRIKSNWLRCLYDLNGLDPDFVDTMKLIPEKVPGGVILRKRTHKLNDNLQWRLRR